MEDTVDVHAVMTKVEDLTVQDLYQYIVEQQRQINDLLAAVEKLDRRTGGLVTIGFDIPGTPGVMRAG